MEFDGHKKLWKARFEEDPELYNFNKSNLDDFMLPKEASGNIGPTNTAENGETTSATANSDEEWETPLSLLGFTRFLATSRKNSRVQRCGTSNQRSNDAAALPKAHSELGKRSSDPPSKAASPRILIEAPDSSRLRVVIRENSWVQGHGISNVSPNEVLVLLNADTHQGSHTHQGEPSCAPPPSQVPSPQDLIEATPSPPKSLSQAPLPRDLIESTPPSESVQQRRKAIDSDLDGVQAPPHDDLHFNGEDDVATAPATILNFQAINSDLDGVQDPSYEDLGFNGQDDLQDLEFTGEDDLEDLDFNGEDGVAAAPINTVNSEVGYRARRTKYFCQECNVYLHPEVCFKSYHDSLHMIG